MDGSLRPQTLDEYVGQPQMVRRLRIAIRAAQERNESLPHILFHGGPGLGKTTIAGVIANEMGEKLVSASAPAVRDREEMWHLVGGLHRGEMLFIDEIHRLSAPLQEFLYPVMEDFTIDRMLDLEDGKQTFRFDLPKFTLLAATTHAGALSAPLRDRFGMICRVEYYSAEELARIVQRSAGILRMQLAEPDTLQIAKRSRCTPRVANRLLQRVRDYALVHAGGEVNTEVVEATLELEGIDADGLDDLDRRYLDVLKRLYKGGPAGVEALAASLDESVETLVDMVEPYLIQRELIVRTPRGRKAIQ
ncbi:MAG: Holliday junction branch migration DNA helicase RuvB [Terriglobia bacterium]